jgi:hypothetical protein
MSDLVERLRSADMNSQQRVLGSRIFGEAADEITRLRAALSDAQVVGFAAGVEAAATLVATHAYTSGSNGMTLEPSEMARHDMHHHTIAKGIRALTPPDLTAAAARVLLDDLALALSTEIGVAGGKEAGRRWSTAHDAAESAPTAMSRATPIQMIRAALRAIAGDTP